MKPKELLRLVWLNIIQNKFKAVMTSIGIIVGAATIVMVISIGKGGQMDVEEQFKNLNAGAIDISYEKTEMKETGREKNNFPGGGERPSGGNGQGGGQMPEMPENGMDFRTLFGEGSDSGRMNQEKITLQDTDVEDIEAFVPDISAATISYTAKSSLEGGEVEESQSYTIAGVKENYARNSNLKLEMGEFITESNGENKEKVCVLGADAAKEIFGSAIDAYGSVVFIDSRPYVVNGILKTMGTVSSGISPDDAVFLPYETGIKYLTGEDVSPTVTVIAEDVSQVEQVKDNLTKVLAETYPNTDFTYTDAGSRMEAASASNDILTMLLSAMAVIVFLVGGIGIMNVLFVSVKERTNEIGILKSIGCPKKTILKEFLMEAAAISLIGGVLGVLISAAITPLVEKLDIRVELSGLAFALALVFALVTGVVFGFYPAWKASRLIPVDALNAE